jgi:hypothetical protein
MLEESSSEGAAGLAEHPVATNPLLLLALTVRIPAVVNARLRRQVQRRGGGSPRDRISIAIDRDAPQ